MDKFTKTEAPDLRNVQRDLNPLEEDIALLKSAAECSLLDAETRAAAKFFAGMHEEFLAANAHFTALAKQTGMMKFMELLSNEQIADFVCYQECGDVEVRNAVWFGFVKPYLISGGTLPGCDVNDFVVWMCDVFKAAASSEYFRRRNENLRPEGHAMRNAIIDVSQRGKHIQETASKLTGPLKLGSAFLPSLAVPQTAGGDAFCLEGRKEAESIAIEGIVSEIKEFISESGHIENANFFRMSMDGSLNKAFWHARDFVATRIDREIRRVKLTEEGDARKTEKFNPGRAGGSTLLDNLRSKRTECEEVEQKLLFEQILACPDLSKTQRKVLFTVFVEGHTESETAESLGISQGQVSKTKRKALETIKRAFSNYSSSTP
jgi:RNA polymerase sigma factor (sigma-70 family)